MNELLESLHLIKIETNQAIELIEQDNLNEKECIEKQIDIYSINQIEQLINKYKIHRGIK